MEASPSNNSEHLSSQSIIFSHQSSIYALPLEPLVKPHRYILEGGESLTTQVAVYKGPGKTMRFDPITLFLRSSCMSDQHNPVEVTEDLWNQELGETKSLVFTPPCPAIRWAGSLVEDTQLVFSRNILADLISLIEVSIFNEVCSVSSLLYYLSCYNV